MSAYAVSSGGQNHDRLPVGDGRRASMQSPEDDGPDDMVEITASQKMMSAISGSLLTSLLVTPLDVVRVRWQSQAVSQPGPSAAAGAGSPSSTGSSFAASTVGDFRKLTVANPATFRPQDLGVTACCREVFFGQNNAEYCLAVPRGQSAAATATTAAAAAAAAADSCAVEETQRRTITSTVDGLRKIARNEGFFTLWRGLSPTLLMAVPGNIIYFTGYDWLRFNPRSPIAPIVHGSPQGNHYAPLVAGSVARVVAAAAVSPIELFRTRLQATPGGGSAMGHFVATLRGIQDMVGQRGYGSLWRGLTLTLWRDVPFSGIYWWGYETIRGRLTDRRDMIRRGRSRTPRPWRDDAGSSSSRSARTRMRSQSRENHTATFVDSFAAGALSGAFASIVTMPFDVGKTRKQVYRDTGTSTSRGVVGMTAEAAATAPESQSMTKLLWHITRTEGVAGLWRGWIPRTLKVAPACAIMISSYEVGKRAFRGVNERSAAAAAAAAASIDGRHGDDVD